MRALRVYDFDGALRVTVVRGIGYRWVCSCGERGPIRPTFAAARAGKREHDRTHEEE